jgi:hypothetical protein
MTDFERDILRYFDKEPKNIIILNTYVTKKHFEPKKFKNKKGQEVILFAVEFKRGVGATFSKSTTAYVGEKTLEMLSVGDEAVVVFPKDGIEAFRLVKGTYSGDIFKTFSVRDETETAEERKIKSLAKSCEIKTVFIFLSVFIGLGISFFISKFLMPIGLILAFLSLLIGIGVFIAYKKIRVLKKLFSSPGSIKIINAKLNKNDGIKMYFGDSNQLKVPCFGIFNGYSSSKDNECVIVINKLTSKPLMVAHGKYNGNLILTINM